jgi:hypothetical protein
VQQQCNDSATTVQQQCNNTATTVQQQSNETVTTHQVTGVTRFIAVSVKTFVLCLGAAFGLQWVSADVNEMFREQVGNCYYTAVTLLLHCYPTAVPLLSHCCYTNITLMLQVGNCGQLAIAAAWWRIPLYLLCSVACLGQYRFPIVDYWRGLVVQLVAYEVQYTLQNYFEDDYTETRSNIDSAASNFIAAAAAVVTAVILFFFINRLRRSACTHCNSISSN